jgi:hypothetical protein
MARRSNCWLLQRGDKPTGIPAINLEAQKSEASSRPNHPRVHKTHSAEHFGEGEV